MLSAIGKSCALAVMAAGLSATALPDVAEARGGRGGGGGFHRGGGNGFRQGGGFRNHSPRGIHANQNGGRRFQHHVPSRNVRRAGIAPRGKSIGPGVRRGNGRARVAGGTRIASRSQRWRNRFHQRRNHRWGFGRRNWRNFNFGFDFAMSSDEDYSNPYCNADEDNSGGDGNNAGDADEGDDDDDGDDADDKSAGNTGSYDYKKPVTGTSQPTDEGVNQISAGEAAFGKGDYATALTLTDKAIKEMPQNVDLHQFRSLVLFAMQRYRESAMSAHAALVGGQGWNWQMLRGFYDSKDTYTAQLRSLEQYTAGNPKNAAGRFLLGYHYMMMGHADAAGSQMAMVVKLEPRDKLAAKMLAGISKKSGKQYQVADPANMADAKPKATTMPNDEEPLQPGSTPVSMPVVKSDVKPVSKPVAPFNIVGNWKFSDDETVITLSLGKDGNFKWTSKEDGKTEVLEGTYTLVNNYLKMTLAKNEDSLEGAITVKNGNEFQIKFKDAGKDEGPVTFRRQ